MRDLRLMMTMSDFSQLTLRKLHCIKDCISARQLVRVERVAVEKECVEVE